VAHYPQLADPGAVRRAGPFTVAAVLLFGVAVGAASPIRVASCAAMGGATDTLPATTPPFPNNGPGLRPNFDGVELLLLDHATPPQKLLAYIDKLDTEIEVAAKNPATGVNEELPWPKMTPELTELLTLEAITTWDYDLIRLNTVRAAIFCHHCSADWLHSTDVAFHIVSIAFILVRFLLVYAHPERNTARSS